MMPERKKRFINRAFSLFVAIFVFASVNLMSGNTQTANAAALGLDTVAAPRVDSPSCVVMDGVSGAVLFEKDAYSRRMPASLTKMMTLVLALEDVASGKVGLLDEAVASENAWEMGGTEVWAEPGESMPLDEWLKAVAVGSANDGAVVVAEFLSGSVEAFADRMNSRAFELGMQDTGFKNPHGLDEDGHYTTAMDMAILSKHAAAVPYLLDYTKIYQTGFRGGKNELTNFNKLVYLYDGADGLKTGMTSKSGYCISATAQRGDSRFIVVLMGVLTPEQRQNDAWRLLDWAFANFKSLRVVDREQSICQVRVRKGRQDVVEVISVEPFAVTITKNMPGEIKRVITLDKVTAPIAQGDKVGELAVEIDGEAVAALPLVSKANVERANFFDYAIRYIRAFMIGR
jgi:D-alanyl-D-alanine carboxypeptidase (penicillin-binding protein 5/6)